MQKIVTTAQAVYYYTHYRNDPWPFKVLVAWVVFLDLFHQICIEHNGRSSLDLVRTSCLNCTLLDRI